MARALARAGRETLVIEAEHRIGSGASSRNSEVVHAGLYYTPGSHKARHCVAGRDALYDYCEHHGIEHRRCGKLIVATSDAERPRLEQLAANARASGVHDLRLLDRDEALRCEPELNCVAALESPSSGIFDSHAYLLALQGDAEHWGAHIVLDTLVTRLDPADDRGIHLFCAGAAEPALTARCVINAAGLGAQALALTVPGLPAAGVPPLRLSKGNYFSLSRRAPFSRLVYPLPPVGGLGIHLTLDLQGRARFGPDVEWIDTPRYDVDPARRAAFAAAIRSYWPPCDDAWLEPAYAGVRARLSGPDEPTRDFVISTPADHGIGGLISLFGIESPGLTSSLSLADEVARLAENII